MPIRRRSLLGLLALSALTSSSACDVLDDAKETGRYGNLQFVTDTDDALLDFDNAVAIGALLDISVSAAGGGDIDITDVSFRSDGRFEVAEIRGSTITVRAIDSGSAQLEVTANGDDGELDDVLELEALEVDRITLGHDCNLAEGKPAHYMVGTAPALSFKLVDRYDQLLLGYGYAPVSISPSGGMEIDDDRWKIGRMYFTAPEQPGDFRVASNVGDEPVDFRSVDFRFVDVAAIDGVKVNGLRTVGLNTSDPKRKVWPLVDGERVCRASVLPTVSGTSTNCRVEVTGEPYDEFFFVEFTPLRVGPCNFTLSVPGSDAVDSFEFQITERDDL